MCSWLLHVALCSSISLGLHAVRILIIFIFRTDNLICVLHIHIIIYYAKYIHLHVSTPDLHCLWGSQEWNITSHTIACSLRGNLCSVRNIAYLEYSAFVSQPFNIHLQVLRFSYFKTPVNCILFSVLMYFLLQPEVWLEHFYFFSCMSEMIYWSIQVLLGNLYLQYYIGWYNYDIRHVQVTSVGARWRFTFSTNQK